MAVTSSQPLGLLSLIVLLLGAVTARPYPSQGAFGEYPEAPLEGAIGLTGSHHRQTRSSPTPAHRESCGTQAPSPANRVNSSRHLSQLRQKMTVQAYIIPMGDAHQSEYVSDHDKRVQFLSGFSGSAGTAVVVADSAALWVDGRYFLQAEQELDCQWTLMRIGTGVPKLSEWLAEVLRSGDQVAADPRMVSYDTWQGYEDSLKVHNLSLVEQVDLVGVAWDEVGGRPPPANHPLLLLGMQFAGESWQHKVERVRAGFEGHAEAAAITALDEIAWLFNLRGSDIAYNPVFFAYSIIEKNSVTLYLLGHKTRLTVDIKEHLNLADNDTCLGTDDCVQVKPYDLFYADMAALTSKPGIDVVWVSPMSSYALASSLGRTQAEVQRRIYLRPSLIRTLKGRKNPVEVAGLRKCHIRDSAALIEFVSRLERDVKENLREWDEISAAEELGKIRRGLKYNKGLSFASISASGSNGAIIHYRATEATVKPVTGSELYLLDSGGQYLDGTTDVTRTFHFGAPTDFQKEAYTRVLMGVIDLATAVWPQGTFGRDLDVLARRPLWEFGLNYPHGTGHGVGAFLNVHEGPGRISTGCHPKKYEAPLDGEMFLSDEPGYYQEGEFGIRLETIVMTTQKQLPYNFGHVNYFGFTEFTLVPFEPHLIKSHMLNKDQCHWLNNYHKKVQEEVAEKVLKPAGKMLAYDWVTARTKPMCDTPLCYTGHAPRATPTRALPFLTALLITVSHLR